MITPPTTHQFTKYQKLYDYYNQKLFNKELPFCLLILSRRMARVCGHFSKDRWRDEKGNKTHEINLNPVYLARAEEMDICQTLVHEMVHLWQYEFGKPSRRGYHNKEWAAKMQSVGLMPSDTGMPGGKITGERMSDYPIVGGIFEKVYKEMPKDLMLPFKSAEPIGELEFLAALIGNSEEVGTAAPVVAPTKRNKTKYTCLHCKANVWGKPELEVICRSCLQEAIKIEFQLNLDILDRFMMVER